MSKKKTSPLTKAQLLDVIDGLRDEVKELRKDSEEIKVKKSSAEVKFEKVALGLYKTDSGEYKLVRVGYDPVSGEAGVISSEYAAKNPRSFPLAMGKLEDTIYDEIEKRLHRG